MLAFQRINCQFYKKLNLSTSNSLFPKFYIRSGFKFTERFDDTYEQRKNSELPVNEIREKLIKMSLMNVNKYGWTENSIKIAANELGFSQNLASILDKGALDLIYYTMDNWNDKLKQDVEVIKSETNLTLDDKLKKAIKIRLGYETPLIATWPAAIGHGMNVRNITFTLEKLINSVNIIASIEEGFDAEGIKYNTMPVTKKYLLLKTMIVTELHMITDRSYNYTNTWDFLDKFYHFNFGIYSSLSRFAMINTSLLTILKYSFISLAPYDFSQVDKILREKFDMEQQDSIKL
jgi:rpsU-divergently transcribed protein